MIDDTDGMVTLTKEQLNQLVNAAMDRGAKEAAARNQPEKSFNPPISQDPNKKSVMGIGSESEVKAEWDRIRKQVEADLSS